MKASFLNHEKPLLCAMIQAHTPDDAICQIMNSLYDGADAFGIQLENLRREYRDPATLKKIFSFCGGKPIYITSYRNSESTGYTDEECVDYLLMGLDAGATICDIMGDFFCPDPHQFTWDPEAAAKQKALADEIHRRGGEVLISSHINDFIDGQEVLRIAKAQKARGADVAKIVNHSQTEEQMHAGFAAIRLMKEQLGGEFLYLGNGPHSRKLRTLGPSFGVCMYLCVQQYGPLNTREQPQLRAMKAVRDNLHHF